MNTNNKHNAFTTYINTIKIFFYISITIIFFFGIIAHIISPDERDVLNTNCRIFESEWEQVLENGHRIPVEFPGKVEADYGELVTFATTLPQNIFTGECLCFRPIWQDVSIYIDGELRLSYNTDNSRPFGTNSAMRYIFVELEESDAGKELTYQCSSDSKYSGDMRISYIGDRLSIWLYLFENSGIKLIVAIFLLLLSLFCIIVCGILKVMYKKHLPLIHLAWTLFFCAFWMLSETDFRQLFIKNVSILSNYAYWCLMLIPIPLMTYINEIQDQRYKKIYSVLLGYSSILLVIGTFLQVFDIAQFVHQIPFIHLGILGPLIAIIATITMDTIKKLISNYFFVGIGLYGMLFTAILEMAVYYIRTNVSLGTILGIGLLFLLIMAIIKTGQDLFISEKKKQQAITARESQTKFLANMSHEIRTPINAIIGMNEMILRESANEEVRKYAHNIESASNMLLCLINNVLDFSKIESGQLELVEGTYELATLINDEMLLMNTRIAGKPISIVLDIEPNLPSCFFGDELRIKQILTNLLSNAAKYTERGTVTLKAFFKPLDEDKVSLCFSVMDTGHGIKQEDINKLFDSFKRLELKKNRNIEGTGLGLNIVKQIVDLMHGDIIVESDYGKGSTFTVSIPQKVMNKKPIGDITTILNKSAKEKTTTPNLFTAPDANVLIVDDNSMNLTLMKNLFKRSKLNVDLADSGKKCLELTQKKKYDIIFMDHMMPELDGVETLDLLRSAHTNPNRNSIVIALTANAIAGCREQYLEYGFNDYFAKPVQADKLDELILKYLPGELVHIDNSDKPADNAVALQTESSDNTVTEQATSTINETSSELLIIDHETGIHYCMDSEKFYLEILVDFCKLITQYLPQLETHFQAKDWKNYAIIAHSIKSSSLNIGATNFSKYSLQHELAGKEKNEEFIEADYSNYISTLRNLIKKIEEMLA